MIRAHAPPRDQGCVETSTSRSLVATRAPGFKELVGSTKWGVGGVLAERVGHIVEKRLERVGRIYPVELKVGRHCRESKVEAKE